MAIINATRMELLKLKKRLELARRGHKLLKDKLDGLIQKYIELINAYASFRNKTEKDLQDYYRLSLLAVAANNQGLEFDNLSLTSAQASIEEKSKNIVGVKVPEYALKLEGQAKAYGMAFTSVEMDRVIDRAQALLPQLISMAGYEKALSLIGRQIIEIRHRVNALEYKLIPELEGSIRFIRMKLAENERSYLVTLMKIKDIIRGS